MTEPSHNDKEPDRNEHRIKELERQIAEVDGQIAQCERDAAMFEAFLCSRYGKMYLKLHPGKPLERKGERLKY